jgi:hypothetical protein
VKRAVAVVVAIAALAVIGAATAGAARHPDLWATVNVCDPASKPGAVGVRVSIPREKGAPAQWARIRLQYFDSAKRAWRFVRSGGDAGWARIGIGTRLVQGGTTFTFPPPKAGSRIVVRGVVDVQWRRGRRVVDHAQLHTTTGHADRHDPHLQISRRSCEIKR